MGGSKGGEAIESEAAALQAYPVPCCHYGQTQRFFSELGAFPCVSVPVIFTLPASLGDGRMKAPRPIHPSIPFPDSCCHSAFLLLLLSAKLNFPTEKKHVLGLISGGQGTQWNMSKYPRVYARCTKTQFHRIPIGRPSPFSYSYSCIQLPLIIRLSSVHGNVLAGDFREQSLVF